MPGIVTMASADCSTLVITNQPIRNFSEGLIYSIPTFCFEVICLITVNMTTATATAMPMISSSPRPSGEGGNVWKDTEV